MRKPGNECAMKSIHPFMSDFNALLHTDGIKVYSIENQVNVLKTYSRRDLYKIFLLSGPCFVQNGDQAIPINSTVLLFSVPGTGCTWKLKPTDTPSYRCVFTRKFLTSPCFRWLNQCNLFFPDNPCVYYLNDDESHFIGSIFHEMISAQDSTYPFKRELIRDQISVLLHTALSMKPSENYFDFSSIIVPSSRHVGLVEMRFLSEVQVLYFN